MDRGIIGGGAVLPRRWAPIAATLLVLESGVAQASTSPGAVRVDATFECLGVRAAFDGDPDGDNSATVAWRPLGATVWNAALAPVIDRRENIGDEDNTANLREARVSIVGLAPDTEYEVQVTWSDPDGIDGARVSVAEARTLSLVPPSPGDTLWVDAEAAAGGDGVEARPFQEIGSALQAVSPGDTVRVRAGSYPPFTLDVNGDAGGWIVLQGEPGARIESPSSGPQIRVEGSYLRIIGFTFAPTQDSSSEYAAVDLRGAHHVFVEDNTVEDISPQNVHYGDAGVLVRGGSSHIYVLGNSLRTSNPTVYPDNGVYGVYFRDRRTEAEGGFVIADNTIEGVDGGHFRDGVGGEGNSCFGCGPAYDTDVARNLVRDCSDDGLEIEGGNINVRVWGNRLEDAKLALAPTVVGPCYVFRNTVVGSPPGTSLKLGNNDLGYMYFLHNTIDVDSEGLSDHGGSPRSENMVVQNNIISVRRSGGYTLYQQGRSNRYDYNLHHNLGGTLIRRWEPGDLNFSDLTTFFAETGQGEHGRAGDPLLVGPDQELDPESPAIDGGVVLPNFNDAASGWPFSGALPDMGARERPTGADATPPTQPAGLHLVAD